MCKQYDYIILINWNEPECASNNYDCVIQINWNEPECASNMITLY